MTPDPYGAIRNGPGVRKVKLPLGTVVIRAERVNGRTLGGTGVPCPRESSSSTSMATP